MSVAALIGSTKQHLCGWDLAEWFVERLTVNAEVATALVSIPVSSDTAVSDGRQMKQCWIKYWNIQKSPSAAAVTEFKDSVWDLKTALTLFYTPRG